MNGVVKPLWFKGSNMEFFNKEFCLEVWGDYACFTRPEMKVERVSYDVITPSAARGIFEAIFWKPAIRWHIKKIEVLNPVKWISVRRNEVGSTMSPRSKEIFIEDRRQQKAGLFLRDVRYRITAEMEFIKPSERFESNHPVGDSLLDPDERQEYKKDENPGKYYAMFQRRAGKGQCFNQPYLGCREFSAYFRLVEDTKALDAPWDQSKDLGYMLYDMDFSNLKDPTAMFFRAQMDKGIIHVPSRDSEEVLR